MAVALVFVVSTVGAEGASPSHRAPHVDGWRYVDCAYLERGPAGSAGNVLQISSTGRRHESTAAILSVVDGRLVVRDIFGPSDVPCLGPQAPTVYNVDRVKVLFPGRDYSDLEIHFVDGRLGPGATPEPDGRSEIEISAAAEQMSVEADLDSADDRVDVTDYRDRTQINLDGGRGDSDPDLSVSGARSNPINRFTELHLGRGVDRARAIAPPPGEGIGNDVYPRYDFEGEQGSDLLLGDAHANLLYGGPGDDVELGRGGADSMNSSRGDDVIRGMGGADFYGDSRGADDVKLGHGKDRVYADHPSPGDSIDCGPDHDIAEAPNGKHLKRCEQIKPISGLGDSGAGAALGGTASGASGHLGLAWPAAQPRRR